MLEIITLIFIAKYIGKLAIKKGLKPGPWKMYTIVFWFALEIIGIAVGLFILNSRDIIALQLLGWIFGVGSFLVIRSILLKKPIILPRKKLTALA